MITKRIFNYCNTDFSLEISSEVQNVHKRTFTYKLTTKCNFQMPTLFYFCSTIMELNAQDYGISNTVKDTSVLPSKINQMKVSQETGSEANMNVPCCLPTLRCVLRRQHFPVFRRSRKILISWFRCVYLGMELNQRLSYYWEMRQSVLITTEKSITDSLDYVRHLS